MKPRYTVYKSDISYFSGKLEAYLRYKGIVYKAVECGQREMKKIAQTTGVKKMPAVAMDNGQWLFDTTPMLEWFEQQHPEPCTVPDDPALAFLALLIEDYGDEWLWRAGDVGGAGCLARPVGRWVTPLGKPLHQRY